MELTVKERLFLINQYRILQHLSGKEDAEHYKHACQILEAGYTNEYGSFVDMFSELPLNGCDEVVDILDMHRHLNDAFESLADKSGINASLVKFGGFDGNNEGRHMSYATFLIKDQGKWQEFKHIDLNSHHTTLARYREML
jgi:uncharacterized protein YfbU (UPF0304 family)